MSKLTLKAERFISDIELSCWKGAITPNPVTLEAIFAAYDGSNVDAMIEYFTAQQADHIEYAALKRAQK